MTKDALVAELATYGVATAYEAAGRRGLIDVPLTAILPQKRIAGRALTVACGQNDNLAVHACIEHIQPGSIIVVAMPEPRPIGLIGELLAVQMKRKEAAGVLVDAAVRDVQELQALGLPIWTRYVRAAGATKDGTVGFDGMVTIGGSTIHDGDIVVLDDDGAMVVASADALRVCDASRERVEKERALLERFERGEISIDTHGLRSKVQGGTNT